MLRLKRIPLVVVLVGAVTFSCAQDLNQKVTYRTTAVSVKKAVDDIAKATKAPLDTSPTVDSEIVVIDVKDVTITELMERLALATSCKWQKIDRVFLLMRPTDLAKAEEITEQKLKLEAIKKAVAKLMEPITKTPALDAKTAEEMLANQKKVNLSDMTSGNVAGSVDSIRSVYAQGANEPAGRATAKLLSMIDLAPISRLKEEDRIVYSSRPNRMQIGLGQQALAVLNQFVLEQNIWADAVSRRNSATPKTDGVTDFISMGTGSNNSPVTGTPDKALLCVEYNAMLDSYDVRIKIYDNKGALLFEGGQSIMLETSMLNALDSMLKPVPTKDPEIQLSKDSAELLAFWRGLSSSMMGAMQVKNMSKELYEKLSKPDLYDPLAFIHSEALMATAKARNEQLVADVPDSIMKASSFMLPGQKLTTNSFLSQLSKMKVLAIIEEGGWMVVKSARPSQDRAKRLNRVALAKLIGASNAKGYTSLDDIAGYALNNNPLMQSEIAQMYALVMLPGALVLASGGADWNMYRFYGSLGATQRQALGRGDAIAMRSLSPNQVEYVRRMAFQPSTLGSRISIDGGQNAPPSMGSDYRSEPTELMPTGLPRDGSVSVKIKHDTVVKDAGPNQPRLQLFSAFGPDELAGIKMVKDDPTMSGMIGALLPELNKFRVGDRVNYTFTFRLTPEAYINQNLSDTTFDPKSPIVDMNGLPGDFKKRYNDLQEQMKKSGGLGNIFGGTPPPIKP